MLPLDTHPTGWLVSGWRLGYRKPYRQGNLPMYELPVIRPQSAGSQRDFPRTDYTERKAESHSACKGAGLSQAEAGRTRAHSNATCCSTSQSKFGLLGRI